MATFAEGASAAGTEPPCTAPELAGAGAAITGGALGGVATGAAFVAAGVGTGVGTGVGAGVGTGVGTGVGVGVGCGLATGGVWLNTEAERTAKNTASERDLNIEDRQHQKHKRSGYAFFKRTYRTTAPGGGGGGIPGGGGGGGGSMPAGG